MITGSIPRRYAKALFALATERGREEAWAEGLAVLKKAMTSSKELAAALASPIHEKEQRRAFARRLGEALRLDPEPASLLLLLADRNRLGSLPAVADHFGALADEKLGRVRAQVVSAVPLEKAAAERLGEKLSRATGAQVLLERRVEPALIGGVVATVGSLTYDGSLRTQLEALRRTLKQ